MLRRVAVAWFAVSLAPRELHPVTSAAAASGIARRYFQLLRARHDA